MTRVRLGEGDEWMVVAHPILFAHGLLNRSKQIRREFRSAQMIDAWSTDRRHRGGCSFLCTVCRLCICALFDAQAHLVRFQFIVQALPGYAHPLLTLKHICQELLERSGRRVAITLQPRKHLGPGLHPLLLQPHDAKRHFCLVTRSAHDNVGRLTSLPTHQRLNVCHVHPDPVDGDYFVSDEQDLLGRGARRDARNLVALEQEP